MKTTLAILLAFALAACGGGGSDAPAAPEKPAHAASTSLVVIGNSLTMHPPRPDIGWLNDWGMASSTRQADFAHVSAAALGLPLEVHNISGLETSPDAYVPHIPDVTGSITATTAVVIELGDNVQPENLPAWGPAYAELLKVAARGNALLCLSTWWSDPRKDIVIKAQCEASGGTYVYIGDILTDPQNRDLIDGPQFTDPGVQAHPHDWGMRRIGLRVAAALQ